MDEQILAFDDPADRLQTTRTMPPFAASVHWARNMRQRIQDPVDQLKALELPILEEEEAKVMFEKQEELSGILEEVMNKTYKDWQERVKNEAESYLTEYLISREDMSSIQVSFNSEVRRSSSTLLDDRLTPK